MSADVFAAPRLAARGATDFVLTLRRRWADTLYPALRAQWQAHEGTPDTIAEEVHSLPLYPWFAWLERGSQKLLWRAVADQVRAEGEAASTTSTAPARLELDPDLVLPSWYTEWDIHLQPGGVWRDRSAAAVYERGAQLVMLGDNDDYKFHRLFTQTALPAHEIGSVVDLGCGFGKSTWPLQQRFANAQVTGIDLAAPCLELAAHRAGKLGLPITFRQADVCATGLPDGSVDLITSTMLLHELPLSTLPALFAECARLLRPRGTVRFLDFHLTGDSFRDLAMLEHSARNNEPYLAPLLHSDITMIARKAGLANVRWTAFDERGDGRLQGLEWPARSEWHFPWAVLEAERA
ncbi:MAG: class I SAM-dependent methyltransferase [Steroidobacteraceae bacterium]